MFYMGSIFYFFSKERIVVMIDFIASIPYRIAGLVMTIFSLLVSVPFVLLPAIFSIITSGRTIQEARNMSETMFGSATIKEMFDAFSNSGIILLQMTSILMRLFIRGYCMLIFGIYYDEAMIESLNRRISDD